MLLCNSRQPMLWLANGSADGQLMTAPATKTIARNFVFRNSFRGPTSNKWCLDKDDGSSNYLADGNVLMYGAIKARDGLWRIAQNNLLMFPDLMPFEDTTNTKMAMAFQVNGFAFDFFVNNTVVSTLGEAYNCGGGGGFPRANVSNLRLNSFLIINGTLPMPKPEAGCSNASSFADWQALGFDAGSRQQALQATDEALVQLARSWLPLI